MAAATRKRATVATLLVAGALGAAGVLLGAASSATAAASDRGVHIRLSEDEKTGTAPISGIFTVTGAITDHGTAKGTHFPIYRKVNGSEQQVGIELVQSQSGVHGTFTIDCRDTRFVFTKNGQQVTKAYGRCVVSKATGVYTRLAPVGTSVLVPTHPRKGYTHTVRRIAAHTRPA
jgi:hypothetical protein